MLTIDIPQSNRIKTEEDLLSSYILSEIEKKGYCYYFHYGVGWGGRWNHSWAARSGCGYNERTAISEDAHDNVIRAFARKGYSVEYRDYIAAGNAVIIRG